MEVDEEPGQPERQHKHISGTPNAPGYELAGSGKTHALGCHAAEVCPEDQAEQNDARYIGKMTEGRRSFAAGERSRPS